jgi:hypothetical protein
VYLAHKGIPHLIATTTQTVCTRTVLLMQGLSKPSTTVLYYQPQLTLFHDSQASYSRFCFGSAALLRQTRTKNQIHFGSPGMSAIFSMTSTHTNLDWDSSKLHPCFADPLLDRTNFQDSDVSSTPGQNLEDPYATARPAYQIADYRCGYRGDDLGSRSTSWTDLSLELAGTK